MSSSSLITGLCAITRGFYKLFSSSPLLVKVEHLGQLAAFVHGIVHRIGRRSLLLLLWHRHLSRLFRHHLHLSRKGASQKRAEKKSTRLDRRLHLLWGHEISLRWGMIVFLAILTQKKYLIHESSTILILTFDGGLRGRIRWIPRVHW